MEHTPKRAAGWRLADDLADEFSRLSEVNAQLLRALEMLMPWMGRALADDAFAGCALPLAANKAVEQANAAIQAAKGD